MNKKRDDKQSPKLSAAGSELKDQLGLEPVLINGVWHYRIKDMQKALNHVPIERVFDYPKSMKAEHMPTEEAIRLVREALSRLEAPSPNANGGESQIGGAYWRLAKVLRCFLEPMLEPQEGREHADFILKEHGRIVKP